MSKTPRTDEIIGDFVSSDGEAASIMLLRQDIEQLETGLADKDRQLADAKAEIERLKRCCNCEYANHKLEICMHPDNEPETFMDGVCDQWSHNI